MLNVVMLSVVAPQQLWVSFFSKNISLFTQLKDDKYLIVISWYVIDKYLETNGRRHDFEQNDIQHNGTQHNNTN
jgi:hypothetical protein